MAIFSPVVELLLDGIWTNVTSDVRLADGVNITRGRAEEAETSDPATCNLTFNNRDGKYSPRNPTGPYYGKIGRNVAIRITVSTSSRFYGEVSSWPQRWDKTGRDVWTPIQAYGILRRLGQGSTALKSTMYRGLTVQSDVVAYWPCEDAEGATQFASALPGHPAMKQHGTVQVSSFDGFAASAPLPLASNVTWQGSIPAYTTTGETQVCFLMAVPAGGVAATAGVCYLRTTGTAQTWKLTVNTSGSLRLQAFNSVNTQIEDSGFVAFAVNGKLLRVSIELDDSGSGVDWTIAILEVGKSTGSASAGSLASNSVDRLRWVAMNQSAPTPLMDDVALGHISVHNVITSIYGLHDELNAYSGEFAADRFARLCGEEGVASTVVGVASDSTRMGPQTPATLLELLTAVAEADMGILCEARDSLGLLYRTRSSMYSQAAALTLDYDTETISGIEPTEDDDAVRNDVTASRINGSSARAELEVGPLSVNAPPDGIGRYDNEVSISVERDEDLPDQAGWRLHVGTVDEARYPVVGINLVTAGFTSNPSLSSAARDLDVGDRLVIANAPSITTSPEDIQQIVQGFSETITPFSWLIDWNCTPASPWDVAIWNDAAGPGEARYSSDGTTITEDLTLTETGINISTPSGPVWGTTDLPYDVMIGGERMTVTGVSGAGAAQVFTVVRSVNDVVKTHSSGAVVDLFKPGRYAL
jgi:hypothetical protein